MELSDYEECNLCKTFQSGKIFSALGERGGTMGGGGRRREGGTSWIL